MTQNDAAELQDVSTKIQEVIRGTYKIMYDLLYTSDTRVKGFASISATLREAADATNMAFDEKDSLGVMVHLIQSSTHIRMALIILETLACRPDGEMWAQSREHVLREFREQSHQHLASLSAECAVYLAGQWAASRV